MIASLLISWFVFAASNVQIIEYSSGDKMIRHEIEGSTLEIISGSVKRKRRLTKDDQQWVTERIAVLRRLKAKQCADRATLTIRDSSGEFIVCGDQKDAQEFLSVLASK